MAFKVSVLPTLWCSIQPEVYEICPIFNQSLISMFSSTPKCADWFLLTCTVRYVVCVFQKCSSAVMKGIFWSHYVHWPPFQLVDRAFCNKRAQKGPKRAKNWPKLALSPFLGLFGPFWCKMHGPQVETEVSAHKGTRKNHWWQQWSTFEKRIPSI